MKIQVVGAGNIGSILVRKLTRLGHEVAVANSRGPETLSGLADETSARASTIEGALRGNKIVIITIPQGRIRSLPKNLFADQGERTSNLPSENAVSWAAPLTSRQRSATPYNSMLHVIAAGVTAHVYIRP